MALSQAELQKIDDILESTSRIETRCEECSKRVCRHDLDLYGIPGDVDNPGVLTRVVVNEKHLHSIAKKYRRVTASAWAMIVAVVSGLVIVIGNWWRSR